MIDKNEIDPITEACEEVIKMELQQEELLKKEQTLKEQRIAKTYQMLGRIETAGLFEKMANVTSLAFLKEVKEKKIYRDIPAVGTWDAFCTLTGKSRRHVDRDLENYTTFGEDFLNALSNFKVGYRDIERLRIAASDGELVIKDGVVKIDNKEIPLDSDHADELQTAIELLIEDKNKIKSDLNKLKKNQAAIIKEETKALETERDALNKEVQRLKVFDPEDKDPETWSLEQMEEIKKAANIFTIACRKFIIDERLEDNIPLQAQVEAVMLEVEMTFRDLRSLWDDAFNHYDEDSDGTGA